MSDNLPPRHRFVGEIVGPRDKPRVRDLYVNGAEPEALVTEVPGAELPPPGTIALLERTSEGAQLEEILAAPGSARDKLYRIAADHQLNPVFPPAVEAEVEAILAEPLIDDPTLTDLTEVPFVTIDGPGTRDLDQALHIAAAGDGYRVRYALADPARFVRPGSALFDEALRRGASYYLPGLAIPMLPRPLSEGVTSLNERQDRRALVFDMHVDRRGRCVKTSLVRARVHSRAQLTFAGVQAFLDEPSSVSLPEGVGPSLLLLRDVGRKRLEDAERRDVVRYRRFETEAKLASMAGLRFALVGGMRSEVERYNEQLSLMCNVEGARFLKRGDRDDDEVQPIYRVHPRPNRARFRDLEELLDRLCQVHQLPRDRWRWRPATGQSLADYLEALPEDGPLGRIAKAVHRQAVLVNVRSSYSEDPGIHFGVGAEVYARFSAPMREIVGVFLHKEAVEKLTGELTPSPAGDPSDDELRALVVERANESKLLQKRLTKAANGLVLDQLFADDLTLTAAQRPSRLGTVMGLTRSKAHVQLDDPCIEVKVYARHQQETAGGAIGLSDDAIQWQRDDGTTFCRLGDEVGVQLQRRDERHGRWELSLTPAR